MRCKEIVLSAIWLITPGMLWAQAGQMPVDLIPAAAQSNITAAQGWSDNGKLIRTYNATTGETRIFPKDSTAANNYGGVEYDSVHVVAANQLVRGCVKARGTGSVQVKIMNMAVPTNPVQIGATTTIDLLNDVNDNGNRIERCYKVHSVAGPGAKVALIIVNITNGQGGTPVVDLYVKSATLQIAPSDFAKHSSLVTAASAGTYQVIGLPNPGTDPNNPAKLSYTDPSPIVASVYFDGNGNNQCNVIPNGVRPPTTPSNPSPTTNKSNATSYGSGGTDGKNCTIPWNALTSKSTRTTQDIQIKTAQSAGFPTGLFGRSGRVVEFYSARGDTWDFGTGLINYPRTELSSYMISNADGINAFHFKPGKTYRILTSYYLPANDTDYKIDTTQEELTLDVHHECDGGGQALQRLSTTYLNDSRGASLWQVRSSPTNWGPSCTVPGNITEKHALVMDLEGSRGRWIDLDIEYKPAHDNTGRLIIKEDGCTVVSMINQPNSFWTQFPDPPQQSIETRGRLQIGFYKWDWNKGLPLPPGVIQSDFTPNIPISTVTQRKFYYGPLLMGAKPCGGSLDPLCNN